MKKALFYTALLGIPIAFFVAVIATAVNPLAALLAAVLLVAVLWWH